MPNDDLLRFRSGQRSVDRRHNGVAKSSIAGTFATKLTLRGAEAIMEWSCHIRCNKQTNKQGHDPSYDPIDFARA